MATAYLIDTHVLIWMAGVGAPRSKVDELLQGPDAQIVVSAVSAFEIALKVRLGKLESARELVPRWHAHMQRLGALALEVSTRHGLAAASMDWGHSDPFDRLLVAQAQLDELTLVTADRAMLRAPGVEILPW